MTELTARQFWTYLILFFLIGISLGMIISGAYSMIEFEREKKKMVDLYKQECMKPKVNNDFFNYPLLQNDTI